jgi:hypothetical protein
MPFSASVTGRQTDNRGGARFRSSGRRGRFAERPTQRRDLHGELALLDGLIGPRRLNQRVFRNHGAGPLNQC